MPILPPAPTPHISNPSTNLCTFKSGDLCLLVDGFTFSVHHTDTHSIIWKCSKSKSACMATCTTDKSITFLTDFYNRSTHNHEPPSEATYTVTPQSIAQSGTPAVQQSSLQCRIPQASNPSTNLCTFKSGGPCLVVEGFTYSVKHTNNDSIIWKCSKYKSACKATCRTDKNITFLTDFYNRSTHNHEPPSEATYTVTPQSIAQSDAPIPQASNPSTNLCTFKSGGPCLLVDGFTYSVKRTNNDSIIWRCSKYKSECKATCSTDKNVTFLTSSKYSKYTHNHEPPSETAYTTTPQIIKTEASYP